MPDLPGVSRVVHHADAIPWLRSRGPIPGTSVVTSLPDTSEMGWLTLDEWKRWFIDAAALVMRSVPDEGVAIFFQTDIRRDGVWIDKSQLVARGADEAGHVLLFHRIVCREPPGTITFGPASYAHLVAYGRVPRPALYRPEADVMPDGGFKPGMTAMGVHACVAACRFVLEETPTRTILDPFCGFGTVLAVANALGLEAVGVDRSEKMCRRARVLEVSLETA